MTDFAVQIHDLCFAYDSTEVLHNIELAIPQGSYTVIVGPNGGGKTTLLKLMLGLLKPIYGSVSVLDSSPEEARRQVSYVPQALQFDSQFPISVGDVVLMGRVNRHLFGMYSRLDKEVARKSLAQVRLDGFYSRPFKSLSGGERQRVLVAQALAAEPKLLLLDEPGASLDPDNRLQLYKLLGTLTPELTVVLVSHHPNVVCSVATHIICVNRTADFHRIEEVSPDALANGSWAHIRHSNCPVEDNSLAATHTPHSGKHIH